jgi:peptidoglycan DL-endopeptidase CwlO
MPSLHVALSRRAIVPVVAVLAVATTTVGVGEALGSHGTSQSSRPTADTSPKPLVSASPAVTKAAKVPRPTHLVVPTVIVSSTHPLTHHQLKRLAAVSGVQHTEKIDTGTADIDGYHSTVIGVHLASFRAWTPRRTAASNALWASLAAGDLTASFDMGKDAKLPLGKTVPVSGGTTTSTRVGAFASVGLGTVDAVVDADASAGLGLVSGSGVLLSAPKADPLVVRQAVRRIVGAHVSVNTLRASTVIRDAGEFMSRNQIRAFLVAALSRVGKPYVWGATGPDSFDCSGLVLWSMRHAGIAMPRVAQEQYFTGPQVSLDDARPGDLLFWHYDPTDPTDIDHVAIYLGNDKMVAAPHTGLDVQVTTVPTNDLAGVVRVDPALAGQVG